MRAPSSVPALVFSVVRQACALPVTHVVETMRPLPVSELEGAPAFVRGHAVIRGADVRVIDLAVLLGQPADATRFVTVRAGAGVAALAVSDVQGIERFDPDGFEREPLLIAGCSGEAMAALVSLDGDLAAVLATARIVGPRPVAP